MIPVSQTKFPTNGNCWRAAIASFLEIDIDAMPAFEDMGIRMLIETRNWLNEMGFSLFRYSSSKAPADLSIAVGRSPRDSTRNHAVIVNDGEIIHDPHPDNTGLATIEEYWVICKSDDSDP